MISSQAAHWIALSSSSVGIAYYNTHLVNGMSELHCTVNDLIMRHPYYASKINIAKLLISNYASYSTLCVLIMRRARAHFLTRR